MRKLLISCLSLFFLLSCVQEAEASSLENLAKTWQKRLGKDFTVLVEAPFVVAGDEAPTQVKARAKHTVRWSVKMLKDAYFALDPKKTITIFLFKDARSYRLHALKLFGDKPDTPYGYYTDRHRALVMNIATGGGTLVHEIVHPFVDANFPNCPPWFNEGLGSLYEQCAEEDGRIIGRTNWRLAGLKEAISDDTLPTIELLCGMDEETFYGPGSGLFYAMSRYLLYYLQENNQLRKYYKTFHKARHKDPGGYATLKELLAEKDMLVFQKRWQRWVMKLSFP